MEKLDFDKIRKMPPERRVKALKELHEELNELIKERSKEIAESEEEIKDAQEFLKEAEEELRVLEEMQATAPEIKGVQIEKLFEREEPRTAARGPREQALESIAEEAPRQLSPDEQRAYVTSLSRQSIANIYERVNQIREDIKTTGILSFYQQERLDQFREALHQKEEAIKEGTYATGWRKMSEITAAEKAITYVSGQQQDKDFYRTRHAA